MKNSILTLLSIFISLYVAAQQKQELQIPFRPTSATIGQSYTLLKSYERKYFRIKDAQGNKLPASTYPKTFVLIKIEDTDAYLKDSLGNTFTTYRADADFLSDLVLTSSLVEARKKYLNKKLWPKVASAYAGIDDGPNLKEITSISFRPATVIAILPSTYASRPLRFVMKTQTGQIFSTDLYIGELDARMQPAENFDNFFMTEDPKLVYKFTPAVWKMVYERSTPIGIPSDAFELVMGRPDRVNTTTTAGGISQQWVYGEGSYARYYYFKGGKLTAKQE